MFLKSNNFKFKWRTIPYTNGFYQISIFGDIRKVKEEALYNSFGQSELDIYENVKIEAKPLKTESKLILTPCLRYESIFSNELKSIDSIMYSSFHGIHNLNSYEIIHIDGNEYNNRLENLILSTPQDKITHLERNDISNCIGNIPIINSEGDKYFVYNPSSIPVSEYDIDGNLIHLFLTHIQVHKLYNLKINELKNVLSAHNQLVCKENRIFKYGIGPIRIDLHLIKYMQIILFKTPSIYSNKLIREYDLFGRLLRVYNNLYEASYKNHIDMHKLKNSLLTNKSCHGKVFSIEE